MDIEVLERKFEAMGARLKVESSGDSVRIDKLRDRRGEFFALNVGAHDPEDFIVMDVQKQGKHLLLLQRSADSRERPARYLCGHDEREWFVASVPETSGASNVSEAMEALRPQKAQDALERKKVKRKKRNKRKNEAFIRQGEWFFLPVDRSDIKPAAVLKNEPLSRGAGSKPHVVDELYREGGVRVYVNRNYPNGLTEAERNKLFAKEPKAKKFRWDVRVREPRVLVRGRVRHADHKTIHLDGWHEVQMNTENKSRAMANVAFLD